MGYWTEKLSVMDIIGTSDEIWIKPVIYVP